MWSSADHRRYTICVELCESGIDEWVCSDNYKACVLSLADFLLSLPSGIPSQPAVPLDSLSNSGGVTLVLQTRYSGAGDTGSFKFVVRVERVDMEGTQPFLQSFPLPNYQDGEQVMVMPSGLYGGKYIFTAFASNAFGDSDVSEPSRAVNVSGVCFTLAQLHAS